MVTPRTGVQLAVELAIAADGKLPHEVRLFQAGVNRTQNGTYHFTEESARSCMERRKEWGVDLAFDYAHAMLGAKYSADPAAAASAAGWGQLEVRETVHGKELWASRCTWTPKASQKLLDRELRYCSPMFLADEKGNVLELLNVALTSIPATFNADPLMAERDTTTPAVEDEPTMKTLLAMLAVSPEATEAQAVQALTAQLAAGSKDRDALLASLEVKTMSEALGKLDALKESAKAVVALEAEVATLKQGSKKAAVLAMLEAGAKEGKVSPAEVEFLTEMGEKDPARLQAYIAAKPKVVNVNPAKEPSGKDGQVAALTAEQLMVAKALGQDPAKLAAHIAAAGTAIPKAEPIKTEDKK